MLKILFKVVFDNVAEDELILAAIKPSTDRDREYLIDTTENKEDFNLVELYCNISVQRTIIKQMKLFQQIL